MALLSNSQQELQQARVPTDTHSVSAHTQAVSFSTKKGPIHTVPTTAQTQKLTESSTLTLPLQTPQQKEPEVCSNGEVYITVKKETDGEVEGKCETEKNVEVYDRYKAVLHDKCKNEIYGCIDSITRTCSGMRQVVLTDVMAEVGAKVEVVAVTEAVPVNS